MTAANSLSSQNHAYNPFHFELSQARWPRVAIRVRVHVYTQVRINVHIPIQVHVGVFVHAEESRLQYVMIAYRIVVMWTFSFSVRKSYNDWEQ